MIPGMIDIGDRSYRVDKVVGIYEVWTHGKLPFPYITVRTIQRGPHDFQAFPDVVIRNPVTRELEHLCGLGATEDAALTNGIEVFFSEFEKYSLVRELSEQDFAWKVGNEFR